eukprot:g7704.t1
MVEESRGTGSEVRFLSHEWGSRAAEFFVLVACYLALAAFSWFLAPLPLGVAYYLLRLRRRNKSCGNRWYEDLQVSDQNRFATTGGLRRGRRNREEAYQTARAAGPTASSSFTSSTSRRRRLVDCLHARCFWWLGMGKALARGVFSKTSATSRSTFASFRRARAQLRRPRTMVAGSAGDLGVGSRNRRAPPGSPSKTRRLAYDAEMGGEQSFLLGTMSDEAAAGAMESLRCLFLGVLCQSACCHLPLVFLVLVQSPWLFLVKEDFSLSFYCTGCELSGGANSDHSPNFYPTRNSTLSSSSAAPLPQGGSTSLTGASGQTQSGSSTLMSSEEAAGSGESAKAAPAKAAPEYRDHLVTDAVDPCRAYLDPTSCPADDFAFVDGETTPIQVFCLWLRDERAGSCGRAKWKVGTDEVFADGMRREYLLVRAPQKSWGAALSYCRQEGFGTSGELVQIKTQQQHDFLFNHVVDWTLERVWIGGLLYGERWQWLDSSGLGSFSDWCPGEPSGGTESCLQMWSACGFRWNDVACSREASFVCSRPVAPQTEAARTTATSGAKTARQLVAAAAELEHGGAPAGNVDVVVTPSARILGTTTQAGGQPDQETTTATAQPPRATHSEPGGAGSDAGPRGQEAGPGSSAGEATAVRTTATSSSTTPTREPADYEPVLWCLRVRAGEFFLENDGKHRVDRVFVSRVSPPKFSAGSGTAAAESEGPCLRAKYTSAKFAHRFAYLKVINTEHQDDRCLHCYG